MLPLVYLILLADPFSARTTVSSSSLVAFTVNTPLRFDTLVHDSVDFIRFNGVPVTNEVGWPAKPAGVVVCTPILVNIDGDVAREVVTISGTLLEAWDPDGSRLWRSTIPLTDIMAADLDEDHQTEFIGRTSTGVAVLDDAGECLCLESVGSGANHMRLLRIWLPKKGSSLLLELGQAFTCIPGMP